MKISQFSKQLSDANNNSQVAYQLYNAFGAITRYDVLASIAKKLGGKYTSRKVVDKNGKEILTNTLKLYVKRELQSKLSQNETKASDFIYQVLADAKANKQSVNVQRIYNDVKFSSIEFFVNGNTKVTVTSNWFASDKTDGKVSYQVVAKRGDQSSSTKTTNFDSAELNKAVKAVAPKPAKKAA